MDSPKMNMIHEHFSYLYQWASCHKYPVIELQKGYKFKDLFKNGGYVFWGLLSMFIDQLKQDY